MIELIFYFISILYILYLVKKNIYKKNIYKNTYVRVALKKIEPNKFTYVNLYDLKRNYILPIVIIKENNNIKSLRVNRKYIYDIDYSEKIYIYDIDYSEKIKSKIYF